MQYLTQQAAGFEDWLLDCIPLLIFALLAFVLPAILRRVLDFMLPKLCAHLPEWLGILLKSYERPVILIVRVFFICMMFFAAPFAFNTDSYQNYVVLSMNLVVIALIGWGAWRSAPVCRLLLRSAENQLDFSTGQTMAGFFENIYRALVVLFTGIALLDILGVPVTGLLTGAGVAGLAVSLAAQSTLSNLIAGITLVLERPFGVGDYIVLNEFEGTVEEVSFRSTKMRTVDHSLITVENSKVCAEYIQNISDRSSRLWQTTLGVTYDTPRQSLEALTAALADAVRQHDQVLSDTVCVSVAQFSASSIDILIRAYVTTLKPVEFLQFKNEMNLLFLDLVKQNGCDFAFPSTTVYLAEAGDEKRENG